MELQATSPIIELPKPVDLEETLAPTIIGSAAPSPSELLVEPAVPDIATVSASSKGVCATMADKLEWLDDYSLLLGATEVRTFVGKVACMRWILIKILDSVNNVGHCYAL